MIINIPQGSYIIMSKDFFLWIGVTLIVIALLAFVMGIKILFIGMR